MAVFEYLRISLARSSVPLFEGIEMNRQEFLKQALSRRWDFPYKGKTLIYDPISPPTDEILAGIVGREFTEIQSEGPDDHWEPAEHRYWPHALIAVDVSATEQIAAFQKHNRVGSPRGVLEKLLQYITQQREYSVWRPHVEYISRSDDFWIAAREYAGRISSLNFTFVPPNMLRAKEAIDDLVRAASDEANSEATEFRLRNPSGNLVPDGDLVQAAVSTATSGGGEITMKAGKKIIYSSAKNKKTAEVDDDEIPEPTSVERIKTFFRHLLLP